MGRPFRFQGEPIFNLTMVLLGLFIVIVSLQIGFGSLKAPGSGLFPFLCGVIILICNLVLLFLGDAGDAEPVFAERGEFGKYAALTLVLISWILLMPLVGWILVTFLVTLFLAKILRLEGWVKPLCLAAANTATTYFLFGYCLVLDLPWGFGQ